MALTITKSNYYQYGNCDALADLEGTWSGNSAGTESDFYKEGAGCLGFTLRTIGDNDITYTKTTGTWDLSATKHLRLWFLCSTSNAINIENYGIQFFVGDAVNTAYYYLGGKASYPGGWYNLVVDLSRTADSGTKPTDMLCTRIGLRINMTSAPKNVDNTWIDNLIICDGLVCSSDSQFSLEDIYSQDNATTGAWGIVRKIGGIYYLTGKLQMGVGSGSTSCDFKDTSQTVVFEDRLVSSSLYSLSAAGNSGTTKLQLGDKSGTAGISGCSIRTQSTGQTPKFTISTSSLGSGDYFKLYGCNFLDSGTVTLPTNNANREVLNCNFEKCGQVVVSTCTVKYCNFISSDSDVDAATLVSSDPFYMTDCNFISCPDGIELDTVGDGNYDFTNLVFTGCTYDVRNTSGSALIATKQGTTNASTYNSTGSVVTFPGSVTITVTVKNEAGGNIQGAQVYIQKSTPTLLTSDAGNNANDSDFIVNESIDADTPQTGTIIVWNKASNVVTPYRYQSWVTKTFTLRAEETGTCTSTGSGTQLLDTGADFGGATDIQEGDTIRNTIDGSWAVVDEIVSTTELLTSALQGGGDNTWQLDDGWGVNKLALSYTDNDDTVDVPIMNSQTNSSGIATRTYTGASTAIVVRIRSNEGATKYIPYNTAGNITASGYTLVAVMTQDGVAT